MSPDRTEDGVDVDRLGRRLKHLRELRHSSLSALATEAGVSKSYLAKLERGEIENPGVQTLNAIAGVLETTVPDLLGSRSAGTSTSGGSQVAEYEDVLKNLPPGLKEFIEEQEAAGESLTADAIKSLASIQMRGRRPETARDWRFLYEVISRSL